MEQATGAATTAVSPESGPRTDRLELVQQLSGGTVGVVHKAKNSKLGRVVALRQVQVPEWLDDVDELLKRILAEARAASALDHPNIARLYTGGYKKFTVFLTAEFIEGVPIKEYARSLGVADVIALSKQLCSALECAHQKNVVHYGLNPTNIKVLPDGTLKVLDFGLLRDKELYAPTPAKRLESEHYLSPEQLKNKPITAASNLFSAATIVYELLTTRNPFAGKHLGEVDRNITDLEPTAASMAHTRVPESVSRVVMRALAKNQMARFQSCAEFAAALDEALNGSGAKAAVTASATSTGKIPVPVAAIANGKPDAQSQPVKNPAIAPVKPAPVSPPVSTNGSQPSAMPANAINGNGQAPRTTAPPKPVPPAVRTQTMPAAPSKMPVKMMAQWKLVGGIIAGLFVVSAVAISLNHRSKLPAPVTTNSQPEMAQPTQPESSLPVAIPAASPVDVKEVQARTTRAHTARSEPASAPIAMVEGELVISSEPSGATFTVEGRTTESWKTPQTVGSLAPAVYKVTVTKAGYSTETRSVQVTGGTRVALDVKLTPVKAWLTVAGTPVGARILIDGKDTGKFSPAEFTLDPATHSVTLRKDGYFDSTSDIKLAAGQNFSYAPGMKLEGRTDNIKVVGGGFKKLFGGGSSEGMGRIEFRTDPKGAQVIINGATMPKVTPFEIQLEPGNYEITLQKDGYKPVHKTLTTEANQKLRIEESLSK